MEPIINSSNIPEVLPPKSPKVKFGVDSVFDAEKIIDFISGNNEGGGYNFTEIILEAHPSLQDLENLPLDEKREGIQKYVEGVYKDHRERFEKIAEEINQAWGAYAPKFFEESGKIFKSLDWPSGDYRGFITISPPYPRYLKTKRFQIQPEVASGLRITSHEMLHFLFFEYVRQRYTPECTETVEEEMEKSLEGRFKIPIWELSEVFNTALLTEKRFGKGGYSNPQPYPALGGYLKTVKTLWKESGEDIDLFFSKLER